MCFLYFTSNPAEFHTFFILHIFHRLNSKLSGSSLCCPLTLLAYKTVVVCPAVEIDTIDIKVHVCMLFIPMHISYCLALLQFHLLNKAFGKCSEFAVAEIFSITNGWT